MADPARRKASYQDIVDLPEHLIGEIMGGELVVSPRPAPLHAHAASVLGMDVGSPFHGGPGGRGPGGWWILDEPELHLGEEVLVPDLAGWRRERLPRLPSTAWFEQPPDWVCEVLSPSTARHDRIRKRMIYARAGVPWLWHLDPLAKTLEVQRLEGDYYQLRGLFAGGETLRAEPFESVELEMGRWWAEQ